MTTTATRRATSLAEFGPMIGGMFRDDERAASIAAYKARPTDIVISPFGKCGTTWLQQTFHTLRTGGDMDFEDISAVVPWIETAVGLGIDIDAEQRADPRGFKSHMAWHDMPRGARYVVSLRDPKDALVSMYRFMEGWFIEPGAVGIEEFSMIWLGNPSREKGYWGHLLSWWGQRDNPDVMLLSYEHMIDAPRETTARLADFCGIPLTDGLLNLALERSAIGYMLQHKDKFSDPMMRRLSEARCNIPPGGDSAKVRKGGVGGHKSELPEGVAAAMDKVWADIVAPETGFASYAELERALRPPTGDRR